MKIGVRKATWQTLVIVGIFYSGVAAQQQGWFERFFSGKSPQVLKQDQPGKPLVEPHPDAIALQDSFANVASALQPAVVNISAVQITRVQPQEYEFYYGDPNEFFRRFFGEGPQRGRPTPREYRSEGTGSGVIIDPDGYILTNNHVVQGADQLTITLSDNKTYKGKVVGTDPRTDLAVVRIKGSNPFPYAPLGDSGVLRIGDWVLAVGSPFGLEKTVTAGIVSAIRQSLNIEGRTFRNLIQTDAAINRGNSGGPLVNIHGQVVGINTAIYAPTGVFSGIGFAIPVNDAKLILKDLIEKGYVERSWMGVEIAEVDEVIAKQFGLESASGALVNQVIGDSPASKAGMERGDIILEFDGKKIGSIQDLQDIVAGTAPKTKVSVKVLRDGSRKTLTLVTEMMPNQTKGNDSEGEESPKQKEGTAEWLGATFSNVTDSVRKTYSIKEGLSGVLAVSVPPESAAAEAGLTEGDLIQSVNRVRVESVEDVRKIKNDADIKKGLVFDVVRRGRSFYLSYKTLQ